MSDWWIYRPWRMIQTNLREIDMRDIDAERYVADLLAFKANAVLINAAGIIASYPTELPFHYQSPFLTGDSLAEIIEACHAADIRVLARTDFSKVRRPLYEQHPEWAYLTRDGHIVDYNGDVHVCINGEYQQVYALKIIEEVLTKLPFDGIFFNMGGYQVRDYSGNYYGICHCRSCQHRFREMYGLALPATEDMSDPVYRKYRLFQRVTAAEHRKKIHDLIVSIRPDVAIANRGDLGRGFVRQESNTALDRPLPHWQYSASDNTKWVVSSYPNLVCSNTTVDFIDFPYRHVAVSPHQQRLRLAQNLANGGALDFYLIGRIDNHEDRSGFAPVKEMFAYHAAHESEYMGLRPRSDIALLNGPDANIAEFRGWFRFLVEHHYLFDTLMIEAALERPWERYRAIILPDYAPLSDTLLARLDAFVEDGGTLISIGQSGFWDDTLEQRNAPPLRCLGLERVRAIRGEMRSSYFQVKDKTLFPRLADTDLIYMDGVYVYGDYVNTVRQLLPLIPPHPFGPPERCYYTQV
ncbi:MAG: beta-galactosidase trimerization domain-containing protein, partial [Chloroflexi bacterium]|nr:beta-galactosidase trimerization domain-containing protein [Chloroflexota bacterium]